MTYPRLWVSFHHEVEGIDRWAIYLESKTENDCDLWQVIGLPFEYEITHVHGKRAESAPNFKDKWLMKDNLDDTETRLVQKIATNHPVDNDGAYWDCRVYCFEILALLETKQVLLRTDENYCSVRKRLHEKWRNDDGVPDMEPDSEEDDSDEDRAENGTPEQSQVDASSQVDQSEANGDVGGLTSLQSTQDSQTPESNSTARKRTLSRSSNEQARFSKQKVAGAGYDTRRPDISKIK